MTTSRAAPLMVAAVALTFSIVSCAPTEPDGDATWGSGSASLTIAESGATLRLLAAGGCYGSYGELTGSIQPRHFTVPGTYTQLMGVYPGSVEYQAQYIGSISGRHMTLSISVPALQQVLGPFNLTSGVDKILACVSLSMKRTYP